MIDYGQPHPLPPDRGWLWWLVGLTAIGLGLLAALNLIHLWAQWID